MTDPPKWHQVKSGKAAQSDIEYAQYQKRLMTSRYLTEMLKGANVWSPRLQLEDSAPDAGTAYRDIKKARDEMVKQVSKTAFMHEERSHPRLDVSAKTTRSAATQTHFSSGSHRPARASEGFRIHVPKPSEMAEFAALSPVGRFGGIATNPTVRTVILDEPDDDDSTKGLQLEVGYDPTADAIWHRAYIHDQTHWYSHDVAEQYLYWMAFGYKLPVAPVAGTFEWWAYTNHFLGLYGNAELRVLNTRWLSYPPWPDHSSWPEDDPTSLEDFGGPFWNEPDCSGCVGDPGVYSWNMNGAWVDPGGFYGGGGVYYYADPSEARYNAGFEPGTFYKLDRHVNAGQEVTAWLGVLFGLGCREGTANTGWCLLRVFSQADFFSDGTWQPSQPGINYWFYPD